MPSAYGFAGQQIEFDFTLPSERTRAVVAFAGVAARFLGNRLTREPTAGPVHLVINPATQS